MSSSRVAFCISFSLYHIYIGCLSDTVWGFICCCWIYYSPSFTKYSKTGEDAHVRTVSVYHKNAPRAILVHIQAQVFKIYCLYETHKIIAPPQLHKCKETWFIFYDQSLFFWSCWHFFASCQHWNFLLWEWDLSSFIYYSSPFHIQIVINL